MPKPMPSPRLAPHQEIVNQPFARTSATQRYWVARDAQRLGHRLGAWGPPDNPTTFAHRAACRLCGAEVFVDWRGTEQGWQRAASAEIQMACPNDFHDVQTRVKAYLAWVLRMGETITLERLVTYARSSTPQQVMSDALYECLEQEVRARLVVSRRKEAEAERVWSAMQKENHADDQP